MKLDAQPVSTSYLSILNRKTGGREFARRGARIQFQSGPMRFFVTADSSPTVAVFNEKRAFYGRDRRARALTRRRSPVISTATRPPPSPPPHIRPRSRMRAYLLVLASKSLRNSRVHTRAGCTINTAPISFSWRNNPLSGATSYRVGARARARHEAEKGSAFSATEFYISPGGSEHERACTLALGFLAAWPNKNENMTRML